MLASPTADPPWVDDDEAVLGTADAARNAGAYAARAQAPEDDAFPISGRTLTPATRQPQVYNSESRGPPMQAVSITPIPSVPSLGYNNEARGPPSPAVTVTPIASFPSLGYNNASRGPPAQADDALPLLGGREFATGVAQVQQRTGSPLYTYSTPPPRLEKLRSAEEFYKDARHEVKGFPERYKLLWQNYFSLAILAALSAPIVSGLHLAQDPSVKYWVGAYGYIPGLIPAYLALCHAMHLQLGPPKLIPVVLSTVVPCVIIFLVGNFHMSATGIIANMLLSKDCTTFHKKQELHQAWVVADGLYKSCINRTSVEQSIKYEDGFKLFRLHECKEYYPQFYGQDEDPWMQYRSKWNYLRELEENAYCSGWCRETRPLWSFSEVKDPCSVAAGAMLMGKVKPLAVRMMASGMVALICSILSIVYTGHLMLKHFGYHWDRF